MGKLHFLAKINAMPLLYDELNEPNALIHYRVNAVNSPKSL